MTIFSNAITLAELQWTCFYQVVEAGSDESLSNEEDTSTKKRRDILSRRPSYRKILSDLGGKYCKLMYHRPLTVQLY